ncbi:lipid droplet-associated protein [Nocardia yunnanensis]|uniref:Lipid droplet-associated protein n=1 Tax=Nocardia yunnanensis TaxID=2382165 RepID=A0A386Z8H8_9NOCA|nr:lipid droplet-associated protein [Nocardia yunnanensis]AYF72779.1 lipid droplet-associated protein [Nocardia yunnanensis]
MFRPPFLARVAAGAAVYALEETRRLPTTAINFPITAISQMLQTTMHLQQFVTSLALKGDAVFDRLINQPEEQPAWATFDEDEDDEQTPSFASESVRRSRFDLFTADEPAAEAVVTPVEEPTAAAEPVATEPEPVPAESAVQEAAEPETAETPGPAKASTNGHNGHVVAEPAAEPAAVTEPEVAARFDYANLSIAQLRARLRQLSEDDLTTLLTYEQQTFDRAPFVTMLTNRIATVQAGK